MGTRGNLRVMAYGTSLEGRTIDGVCATLEPYFMCQPATLPPEIRGTYIEGPEKRRYQGIQLIATWKKRILSAYQESKVLILTDIPLETPFYGGAAVQGGSLAIVSTADLRADTGASTHRRILVSAWHEGGHLLGLRHHRVCLPGPVSVESICPMTVPQIVHRPHAEDLARYVDCYSSDYCPDCRSFLSFC